MCPALTGLVALRHSHRIAMAAAGRVLLLGSRVTLMLIRRGFIETSGRTMSVPCDQRRIELVRLVPAGRVGLERFDDLRKHFAKQLGRAACRERVCQYV